MFQRNRHLQGAYTNVVKKYGNKIIKQIKYAHFIHIKCACLICMIIIKLIYCCMFKQHLCKVPEDDNYAETCRSKLTSKYIIYRIVHFLC
jgi:hypothetical protein